MTTYRADLTADRDRLIAHLLPGDVVIVQTSCGGRVVEFEYDWLAWHAIYDDEFGLRICRVGSAAKLARNTLVRQRPPISAAVKALRFGGVAYLTCEMRQETNRWGEAYGPLVWLPAGHILVEADVAELVTTAGGA